MLTILDFLFQIIDSVLWLIEVLIIASVVVSWLVAFDVINLRNRAAYNIVRMLEGVCRPLLSPLRRIIPPIGGLDITPMIALIVLQAAQSTLLPALHRWLASLVG